MEATPPTLAARNAFGVLLLVLMPLFVYQAVQPIEDDRIIELLFYLAVGVYFVSWYYYKRKLGGDGITTGTVESEV